MPPCESEVEAALLRIPACRRKAWRRRFTAQRVVVAGNIATALDPYRYGPKGRRTAGRTAPHVTPAGAPVTQATASMLAVGEDFCTQKWMDGGLTEPGQLRCSLWLRKNTQWRAGVRKIRERNGAQVSLPRRDPKQEMLELQRISYVLGARKEKLTPRGAHGMRRGSQPQPRG